MTWKLPLNQIGSGRTYYFGANISSSEFKESELDLEQHPWLKEILNELACLPDQNTAAEGSQFSFILNVEKQSACYRVKMSLNMTPKLECVRSLTEYRQSIDVTTEALYVRAAETKQTGEHELSDGEMEAYEHDGSCLVLSEFVTDVIYTSLPDFPLCQPECKGLCSECGCNLNLASNCAAPQAVRSNRDFQCPSMNYFN